MTRGFSEESEKTKRIRERLRRRLWEMDKGMTPQALERKSSEIRRFIKQRASRRAVFCKKPENQNIAGLSRVVAEKLESLSFVVKKT